MQDHSRELHRINFEIICYGKNKTALTEKLLAAETDDNRALHRDQEKDERSIMTDAWLEC